MDTSPSAQSTLRPASTEPSHFVLPLKLPSALIRIWIDDAVDDRRSLEGLIEEHFRAIPRVFFFSPELVAVPPIGGDPAVVDSALQLSEELLALQGLGSSLRILILPGEIDMRQHTVHLVPDPLLEDFAASPPALEPNAVHLTARAVKALEGRVTTIASGTYSAPSGPLLPIVQASNLRYDEVPWRNPEILGRRLTTVPRPAITQELEAQIGLPLLRVCGALGTGKSRLVWETLERSRRSFIWTRARPPRSGGPTLGDQIIQHILARDGAELEHSGPDRAIASTDHLAPLVQEWRSMDRDDTDAVVQAVIAALLYRHQIVGRPIDLVCDELESIGAHDLDVLTRLRHDELLGAAVRIVLIRRSGGPWPQVFAATRMVDVPRMTGDEMRQFADQLFTGLSLPEVVSRRLIEASAGYPFALEEGAIALIHAKSLRRIYGSFFFGGDDQVAYIPSVRLVRHARAEAERLGASFPVHLLSVLGMSIPPAQLREAALAIGSEPLSHWTAEVVSAGLLRPAESPWGDGLGIDCPAYAMALAYAVPPDVVPRVRQEVARKLADISDGGAARWATYRLLQGTEEAAALLLEVLPSEFARSLEREELIAALLSELHRLRDRGGDRQLELELLWRLLPLARREGRLQQYYDELKRGFEIALDDPEKLVAIAGMKAELDRKSGRLDAAENALQVALRNAGNLGDKRRALLLIELGRILLFQRRYDEAQYLLVQLRKTLTGDEPNPLRATCDFFLGNIALHQSKLEAARTHHEVALAERRQLQLDRPLGKSLSALGAITTRLGNYPLALEYYGEAREVLEKHGLAEDLSFVLLGIGRALARLGDDTGATQPLRQALAIRGERDDRAGEAIARLMVAENHFNLGRLDEALQEARQSKFDFQVLSQTDNLANAEQMLARIRLRQRKLAEAQEHLATARTLRGNRSSAAAQMELAWWAEIALALDDRDAVAEAAQELEGALGELGPVEMRELLDFRLYRCQKRIRELQGLELDAERYLKRAYDRLLGKASHLSPELRHRFLFQIPENREIIAAATREGLSIAGIPADDAAEGTPESSNEGTAAE